MTMRMPHALTVVVAGLALLSLGCGDPDFNDDKTRNIAAARPITLQSEQVTISQQQVDCGVENGLWFAPEQVSQNHWVSRLTEAGRGLKFSDDVSMPEPGFPQPYSQVNGSFDIQLTDILDTRDGPKQGTKRVVARLGIRIPHGCFPNPVPVMGVRKGHFDEGTPVTINFALQEDGWQIDQLIH